MKNSIALLFTMVLLCCFNAAHARLRVPFGKREVIDKVADLPDTPEFEIKEGSKRYINLGRRHVEFNFLWMPLSITEEPTLVGIEPNKSIYYDIPEAELNRILKENNLNKTELLQLGFYTKYGGKIIGIILLLLIIYGYIPQKPRRITPKNV